MVQFSELNLDDIGQKVEIYGPPKTGKTLLAGLVAEHFKTTWLDLEHGYLTLKQIPKKSQENINLIRIPDDRTNFQAMKAMLYLTDGKPTLICDLHGTIGAICMKCKALDVERRGKIQTIDIESSSKEELFVMDSMTQLSVSAMGYAFKGKQMMGNLSDATIGKQEFSHYTIQGFMLDKVLTAIQQSQANWIVISHEESLPQEDGSEKIVPMAGTRNFSKNSARYFDHCVRTSVFNGRYDRNSSALNDPRVLSGSRTGIDMRKDTTLGIVDLLRSVNGSEEEKAIKKNLGA